MRHWFTARGDVEVVVAKDSFSVIDASIDEVRDSVKAEAARRLRAGAVIGSAREGAVVVATATSGNGQVSRVVKRYKKATVALTQRQRQKVATPV
jgi:hypothetical protein